MNTMTLNDLQNEGDLSQSTDFPNDPFAQARQKFVSLLISFDFIIFNLQTFTNKSTRSAAVPRTRIKCNLNVYYHET